MKQILLIFCACLNFLISPQVSGQNNCTWFSGKNPEISAYLHLRKTGISYFLANNNEYIFLYLRTGSADEANSILRNGMIVWIDMDNSQNKKLGVRYPLGIAQQTAKTNKGPAESSLNTDGTPRSAISMANTIVLIGFIGEMERRFPADNPDNFSASVKSSGDGALVYMMRMSLAKLPVRNSREGHGAMPFSIGLEYGFSGESDKSASSATVNNRHNAEIKPSKGKKTSPGMGQKKEDAGSELHWIKDIKLAASK